MNCCARQVTYTYNRGYMAQTPQIRNTICKTLKCKKLNAETRAQI
ncbi:hypothetical protein [Escherichia phage vB_EcoS_PHB17]|uniref:Uncharacterized protein n=1 Tax=Escherichia phage vB_EcoS_PHB17 TaxID=2591407 RepID=A0A514DKL4_9CAUD|nr:hypothetical protein KMB84_gp01 [Escherichia phage vB_EcoS_PHB17]QDH94204.1 hypothetical protein [Escherichia phage vB_EcoS_PHB17]